MARPFRPRRPNSRNRRIPSLEECAARDQPFQKIGTTEDQQRLDQFFFKQLRNQFTSGDRPQFREVSPVNEKKILTSVAWPQRIGEKGINDLDARMDRFPPAVQETVNNLRQELQTYRQAFKNLRNPPTEITIRGSETERVIVFRRGKAIVKECQQAVGNQTEIMVYQLGENGNLSFSLHKLSQK